MRLLNNKYARALTALLLIQGIVFYSVALRAENIPPVAPLASFPSTSPGWEMYKDVKIEQETLDILKADDTLNRIYLNPKKTQDAYLFIAFFKTQRYGPGAALAEELPARQRLRADRIRPHFDCRARPRRTDRSQPLSDRARGRKERDAVLVPESRPHYRR